MQQTNQVGVFPRNPLLLYLHSKPCPEPPGTIFIRKLLTRSFAVPKETAHLTSEVFTGIKEATTQTTLTSNASRTPVEDKDGIGSPGEDKVGKN
jgi:hypothetical protein